LAFYCAKCDHGYLELETNTGDSWHGNLTTSGSDKSKHGFNRFLSAAMKLIEVGPGLCRLLVPVIVFSGVLETIKL
jgi:hypothetical protein